MRFAVTFTTDGEWNTVDTFIVETDTHPRDMSYEQLVSMFETYLSGDSDDAEYLASDGELWFYRHLDSTDVVMPRE